jgi:Tfp pilus assembly protein PilO
MKSQITFFALGITVMCLGLFWIWLVFININGRISDEENEIKKTKKQIEEASNRVRAIPPMTKKLQEMKNEVVELRNQIIPSDSISQAMKALSDLANQFQVKIKVINFSMDSLLTYMDKASKSAEGSFSLPVLFRMEGAYLDFGMFLDNMNRFPYYINFTDIKIEPLNNGYKLNIQVRSWIRIAQSKITKGG